jgi:hypothetical protein
MPSAKGDIAGFWIELGFGARAEGFGAVVVELLGRHRLDIRFVAQAV